MSNVVKQLGAVTLRDLNILRRACPAIQVEGLNCTLQLDLDRRDFHSYENPNPCDAVITFSRPLVGEEQLYFYEMGLRRENDAYQLYAATDACDGGMADRLSRVFQAYRVEEIKQAASRIGSCRDFEIEGKPGWRRVRIEQPN